MEELNIIEQALELATKNGVFTIQDVVHIHNSLQKLKTILTNFNNTDNLYKDLGFTSEKDFNEFQYIDAPLEIFGHADQVSNNLSIKLNKCLKVMNSD